EELEPGHSLTQLTRQRDLMLVRRRERGAPSKLVLDGLDDRRVTVSQDQRRVVADEVQALRAVGVPDTRAVAPARIKRVRREMNCRAGDAAGDVPPRLLVEARGSGRAALVDLVDGPCGRVGHDLSSLHQILRSANALEKRCRSTPVLAGRL